LRLWLSSQRLCTVPAGTSWSLRIVILIRRDRNDVTLNRGIVQNSACLAG
jgi:hypothetical protein